MSLVQNYVKITETEIGCVFFGHSFLLMCGIMSMIFKRSFETNENRSLDCQVKSVKHEGVCRPSLFTSAIVAISLAWMNW